MKGRHVGLLRRREERQEDASVQYQMREKMFWFRVRDTYGIEIVPGQDVPLMLAVSACRDRMSQD